VRETNGLLQLDSDTLAKLTLPGFFPLVLFLPDRTLFLNRASREMFRTSQLGEDFAGKALAGIFLEQGLIDAAEDGNAMLSTPIKGELELEIPGVHTRWVEIRGEEVCFENERGLLAQLVDISAKHEIAEELSRLSELREIMLNVTQNIIRMGSLEDMCQLVLQNALQAIRKASLGSIMLRGEGDIMRVASYIGYSDSVKEFSLPLSRTFHYKASKGKPEGVINIPDLAEIGPYHLIPTAYGEGVYIKSALSAPIYTNGKLFGIISVDSVETNSFDDDDQKSMAFLRDNIEIAVSNHLLYQEKSFLASFDRLTGLHNRAFFEEHFGPVLERAKRYNESFCVALFDVDGLKRVNDTRGHLAGDQVLRTCASNLRRAIRKSDLMARYGGDEFVGMFFETDPQALSERLNCILNEMAQTRDELGDIPFQCGISYGIARYPADGEDIDTLIRLADARMYEQKQTKFPGRT
jgi:diguanylate cyclase (GGDEF)-like protein